ncbi:MAG: hypothetical protein C0448_08940 [Sphingobacteriaceae bacterium]|nr:hypothetical protein [Sphingobacteriaceae bacterium]
MFRFWFYIFLICLLECLNSNAQTNCSTFSSYFGGLQFDEIKGVCVDANKNSYIIGNTYSTDLPITQGLINDTCSGSYDVFVAKFDSCGTLVWSTYFGTSAFDSGEKINIDLEGNIVFCGYSAGTTLPASSGCFQPNNNGGYDCFITKITPNGSIIWCTYFGKSNGDFAYDIQTDELNNIIIGGTSTSTNLYTTINSFQPNHKGNTDAFIARFTKNGVLNWCTYYGGNGNEDIHALAVDNNFNIIGVGETFSTNLNTSVGAYQPINEGNPDVYIIKLDSSCGRVFSTYLGGTGIEDARGIVTDSVNNIYVGGHTNSLDFDVTSSAYQTSLTGSGSDWYLSKWSASGTLLTSTLFGGNANDLSSRLILLPPNNVLLIGKTESTNIPVIGVNNQPTLTGSYDAFLTVFSGSNLQPIWSSFYGGSADEDVLDVSRFSSNKIILVGSTNSTNYPLSVNPYQNTLNNSNDGCISRINIQNATSTGIPETGINNNLTVFPNPFSDFIYIRDSSVEFIEVTTVLGQIIYSSNRTQQINTENFEKGVYFITTKNKMRSTTYKVIKL